MRLLDYFGIKFRYPGVANQRNLILELLDILSKKFINYNQILFFHAFFLHLKYLLLLILLENQLMEWIH